MASTVNKESRKPSCDCKPWGGDSVGEGGSLVTSVKLLVTVYDVLLLFLDEMQYCIVMRAKTDAS